MGEREMGRVLGLRTKILKETRKLRNVSRHPLRLVVARVVSSQQPPRLGRGRGGWAWSRRRRDSVCRRRLRRGICKHIQESLVTEEAQGLWRTRDQEVIFSRGWGDQAAGGTELGPPLPSPPDLRG